MRTLATKQTAINQYNGLGNQLWDLSGQRPTLDLRFAEDRTLVDATTGSNLVDFTRQSSGTYVGSDGLIKTATTNLLTYSEDWNSYHTTNNAAIDVDEVIAPDGTLTGDKIRCTGTASNTGFVQKLYTPSSATSLEYTDSWYLKQGNTSETLVEIAASGGTYTFARGKIDWSVTPFVFTEDSKTGGTTPTFHPIVDVGNGWYRVAITITANSSTGISSRIYASDRNSPVVGDYVYAWGAQQEQSTTVGEYIPTTTAINSAPRFDHDPTTGESLGLLIEESRTNLLLNSATLATQNVTVTAIAHTLSFYGTGTVTLSGAHSATLVGTGAYPSRATLTFTPTAGTLTVTVSGTVEYANLEIDAGGLGASFSTSYIPTEGSTVTRAADVASISGSNFSSWYRQDEGSIYSDFIRTYSGNFPNFPNIYNINDGTGTNRIAFFGGQNAQFFRPQITVSSSDQLNFVTLPSIVPGPNKAAHSFKLNASDFSANGSVTAQDTSVSIPTVTTMNIGVGFGQQFTGCLRRLTYWPSKLAASTLQTITQ